MIGTEDGSKLLRAAFLATLLATAGGADAATFTVTNTNSSGSGSLAAAITSANATVTADVINFSFFGLQPSSIAGALPAITQPVTINGYSVLFSSASTAEDDTTNANILVELDGSELADGATILDIQASNTTIRGLAIKNIPTNGNGIRVGSGKTGVAVHGNFIGTNAGGVTDLSNGIGIRVEGSAAIGSVEAGDRNLILGNTSGIQLRSSGTTVQNNLIGLDADGGLDVGNDNGIELTAGASGNTIGSSDATSNYIAANSLYGIQAQQAGSGNRFARNYFYDNGEIPIDIGTPGITFNDEGDVDEGANGLQNYPELLSVRYLNTTAKVRGILRAKPGQHRIYFYRNFSKDPYGFGEGELPATNFLVTVPADATAVTFSTGLSAFDFEPGENWTMVSEEVATGNTSEFSPYVDAIDGGQEFVVTNTASGQIGSLDVGISLATEGPEPNTIVFDIPGPGPHTINVPNYLNILGGGTTYIDGFTQTGSKPNTFGNGANADLRIVLSAGDSDAVALIKAQNSRLVVQGIVIQSSNFDGISLINADNSVIRGNYIGTDATGTVDVGNPGSGISVSSSEIVTIGGRTPGERNVISGNDKYGIEDNGTNTRIYGNLIGLGSTLQPRANTSGGIIVRGTHGTIGGDEPGFANRIASNGGPGVELSAAAAQIEIGGNSIHDNAGLGIDLRATGNNTAGVTPNDTNDTDTGGNAVQNFPVITGVEVNESSFAVEGTLDVNPASPTTYRIRVFSSPECDPSGHGEGKRFFGGVSTNIDPNTEVFDTDAVGVLEPGEFVTVTATDVNDNTSEFSACFQTPGGNPLCGDASGNGELAASDALLVLKTAVGTEMCQLCACDVNGSTTITSSDALLVLKKAVGQSLTLNCPDC